ncbi:hypothetical protein AAG570_003919 [Ranatra chinensis]|uniref:Ig-like domain-containing protein n=1 Tax=Ranatra chinensis TaxID=642074 RepID=A0ABD0YKF1_9HEMI
MANAGGGTLKGVRDLSSFSKNGPVALDDNEGRLVVNGRAVGEDGRPFFFTENPYKMESEHLPRRACDQRTIVAVATGPPRAVRGLWRARLDCWSVVTKRQSRDLIGGDGSFQGYSGWGGQTKVTPTWSQVPAALPPEYESTPQRIVVEPGQTAVLPCRVRNLSDKVWVKYRVSGAETSNRNHSVGCREPLCCENTQLRFGNGFSICFSIYRAASQGPHFLTSELTGSLLKKRVGLQEFLYEKVYLPLSVAACSELVGPSRFRLIGMFMTYDSDSSAEDGD